MKLPLLAFFIMSLNLAFAEETYDKTTKVSLKVPRHETQEGLEAACLNAKFFAETEAVNECHADGKTSCKLLSTEVISKSERDVFLSIRNMVKVKCKAKALVLGE